MRARLGSATGQRCLGLAGAVLLAAAGAKPTHPLAVPAWLVGTLLLAGAWLTLGRRLPDRVPGVRWLVVTGVLWALPLACSGPLASRDVYAYACQGSLVRHGLDPYRVGVAEQPCPWLGSVPHLWWHTTTPYGPLWLALAGAAAATGSLVLAVGVLRLVAVAGLGLTAWTGYRLARALGVDPVPGAWLAIPGPLMLVHAVSGAHNDALLAGLVVAALAIAARRPGWRPVLVIGALLGLAVAVKATAAVALPFAALLAAGDRRWGPVLRAGALVGTGAVAGYGLVWAATGYGLGWVPALSGTARMIQWTSLPTGVGMAAGYVARLFGRRELAHDAVTAARAVGLLTLLVLLTGLWLWCRGRDARHVVLATGAALAASAVLAPVAFPWYGLLPLAVAGFATADARLRFRLALIAAALALLVLPDGTGVASLTKLPGALLDVALVVALVIIGARRAGSRATAR